jgi:hypothetical protein
MRVTKDQEGEGNFENFTVDVQSEDIPEDSEEMEEFVRQHGDVVGLREEDLPAFGQEVRRRYLRSK